MALSFVEHLGDGTNKTFAVPFPYISPEHVKVAIGGVNTAYTWNSNSIVALVAAPAAGAIVKVYRETPNAERLVDFADDSVIDEALLDLMSQQLFFIAQEAFDLSASSIVVVADGNYDARARRVKNVADPIELTDAVNLKTFKSDFLPRLEAEATKATNAANTSLALKTEFDAKWLGLQQKEADFNSAYNQVNIWKGEVNVNKDAVLVAKNAVEAMATLIASQKASIETTTAQFKVDANAATNDYLSEVAKAETDLDLLVDAAAGSKVSAESAKTAAQASAVVASTAANTATVKAAEATQAATDALGYRNAVQAIGTDAVALQQAVTDAEAAAARAEAAQGATVSWEMVQNKPLTFAPATHTHDWTTIGNKPTTFAPAAHTHAWAEVTGKPVEFTPIAHTHAWTEITGKPAFFSGAYVDLTGKPTTFAPSAHTHAWTEVTGKPTTFASDWSVVANKPTTYPPAAHNHDGVYLKESRVTISTADPSGGVDGDLWFKYTV